MSEYSLELLASTMALSSFFVLPLPFQVGYSTAAIPQINISAIAPGLPVLLLPSPVDIDAPLIRPALQSAGAEMLNSLTPSPTQRPLQAVTASSSTDTYSNFEPTYTCMMPGHDFWLNDTLKATLSRSGLASILGSARKKVKQRIDGGDGNKLIGHPWAIGQFYCERNRIEIYVKDWRSRPSLTWQMLFDIIDVLRYCGFNRGDYEDMTGVFYQGAVGNRVGIGYSFIKAMRGPGDGNMNSDE